MTLFRRILLYYILALSGSLLVVGVVSWREFENQFERMRTGGHEAITVVHRPFDEAREVVLYAGIPSLLIGIVIGVVALRPALRPIRELTAALEKTDVSNLSELVPGSGNGDELDRMTSVFNLMKQRLGSAFTQMSEFTLHASHELKTPLTVMHGTLEQMLSATSPATPDADRIASLLEEVQRLSGIVGQLSFLARADANMIEMPGDPVALHEIVKDLAEEAAILASGHDIDVRLLKCEAVTINGDRMKLRQLFLNLVDNAVKYNQPGGFVELSLAVHEGHVDTVITNQGNALPPDEVARVFDRFYRGDPSHNRSIEGSGLGLSIARSIARVHHGEIFYEVMPDSRTQVRVRLPLARKMK